MREDLSHAPSDIARYVRVSKQYAGKNKAIKYQKDLVSSAMAHVVKMDESGITDLMLQIEAEYERKYGDNVAKKYTKTVL